MEIILTYNAEKIYIKLWYCKNSNVITNFEILKNFPPGQIGCHLEDQSHPFETIS